MSQPLSALIASGESLPSAITKNDPVGTLVGGKVLSTGVRQARNYETGDPEFWDDGNPKQTVVIEVQTTQRRDADDDGRRGIYIKWWGEQRRRFIDCIKKSGDTDVRVGGEFYVAYVGEGAQENRRLSPPKLYEYTYTPPSGTAGLVSAAVQSAPAAPAADPNTLQSVVNPQVQSLQPQPQAAPQNAAQSAAQGDTETMSEETKAALRKLGIDPATGQRAT